MAKKAIGHMACGRMSLKGVHLHEQYGVSGWAYLLPDAFL